MQELSHQAMTVLRSRYLLRNANGSILETPEAFFRRVAREAAEAELHDVAEHWEDRFYRLISELYFLPNSPALMNAGTSNNQLSACFVLPVYESRKGFDQTVQETLAVQLSAGGTGFNFSALPGKAYCDAHPHAFIDPVSALHVLDREQKNLKNKVRRAGANMGILNVEHPDINAFIHCKEQGDTLSHFNISVGISDEFLKQLRHNGNWTLREKHTGKTVAETEASLIWKSIAEQAWKTGDPGIVFVDEMERHNPVPASGKIECTNPCGEVPLLPYEACTLGSLNLRKFIISQQEQSVIDYELLKSCIHEAVRFLDNLISRSHYPLEAIAQKVRATRKIGLGVMGWADLLIALRIPYDSDAAIQTAKQLMQFIQQESLKASEKLAAEKGVFPEFQHSIFAGRSSMRNATVNSIAPTGSISIIAGVSPSIEPLFALAFRRTNILNGETLNEVNASLMAELEKRNLADQGLIEEILETGQLPDSYLIPEDIRQLYKTAHQISPDYHLRHQSAFQEFTDNAVSKTINLPKHATPEDVERIFTMATTLHLKGITVFREGCRSAQVMETGISAAVCNTGECID